jgi:hypothetical protein
MQLVLLCNIQKRSVRLVRIHLVLAMVLTGACGSDARTTGTTGTLASSVAAASSGPTNDCERHGLTLGGLGTHRDPCKFSGEILGARFTGRMAADQSQGAVIAFTNPWPESVVSLTVALFYYDKDGKQLSVGLDGNTHKAIVLTDVRAEIPGNSTTNLVLGPGPAALPLDTDTVEARVLSFALGFGGEFASVDPHHEDRARKGGPSTSTGVPECEAYIVSTTSCALKSHEPSKQRLVSIQKWEYRSSSTPKELAKRCADDTALLDKSCQ